MGYIVDENFADEGPGQQSSAPSASLASELKDSIKEVWSSQSDSEKKQMNMVGLPSLFISVVVTPGLLIYELGFVASIIPMLIFLVPLMFFFTFAILSFFNLSTDEKRDLQIEAEVRQEAKDDQSREYYRNRLNND